MRKLLILLCLSVPFVLQGGTPKLPPDKELKGMVFDSLFAFNKAVLQKNFAQFHEERLASRFREQFPLDKFTQNFQVLVDKGYDMSNIAKSEPVFDVPPAINSDGLLVLQGNYPTQPNKVTFKLTYLYESTAWKLFGIKVEVSPSGESAGSVPSGKELKTLVLDSLLSFNDAIRTEDFKNFYSQIAKVWQKQITPEELLRAFKPFVDQQADISGIARLEPAFDSPPKINEDGFLAVEGSYPSQPSKVSFALKYSLENKNWKLVAINVKAKPDEENASTNKDDSGDDEDDSEDDDEGEE